MSLTYVYDITFLVLFTLATVIFLYRKRHNLQRQGILYLYRTKFGLKLIEKVSKNYAAILKPLQYVIITCGYALMASMVWFLIRFTYIYSTSDVIVRETKIPPILPLVPYLPSIFKVDFLPPFYFTYWIIIIAIVAISHEFAHGIFARLNKIKVKATGFGFLGPFLAAFVEPDEKQMNKSSKFVQLSILAAGTFANVIMTILFGIIMALFFTASFTPAGVNFNSYSSAVVNISGIDAVENQLIQGNNQILSYINASSNVTRITIGGKDFFASSNSLRTAVEEEKELIAVYEDAPAFNAGLKGPILEIDGVKITSQEQLGEEIRSHNPGEEVVFTSLVKGERTEYAIKLNEREGKAYLGIGLIEPQRKGISGLIYSVISKIKDPFIYYEAKWNSDFAWFIYQLLWWMVLINLSVALVNMLPVGIFDGGRFFYLTILGITGNENLAKKSFSLATWLILLVFVWLTVRWFTASF